MAKTSTWKVKDGCRRCKSPAYYYPAKLLLESQSSRELTANSANRNVSVSCTGENDGSKHTLDYIFPTDFEKIQ